MRRLKVVEVVSKRHTAYRPQLDSNKKTVVHGHMVWVRTARKVFVYPRVLRDNAAFDKFLKNLQNERMIDPKHWTDITA